MDYNGEVEVGGPAQVRDCSGVSIAKLAVGPLDNNAYLLTDSATGANLLVDAANEPDRILELCGGRLDRVLTTHCHPDHWLALADVVTASGATTYATAAEAPLIDVPADVLIDDGDEITFGETTVTVRTLVGHRAQYTDHVCTSAAVILTTPDGSSHVFSGDSLFPGGVGNTCADPAAHSSLLNDVAAKLFPLPDTTTVYPGHGFDTTLGTERPHLHEWANPTS